MSKRTSMRKADALKKYPAALVNSAEEVLRQQRRQKAAANPPGPGSL